LTVIPYVPTVFPTPSDYIIAPSKTVPFEYPCPNKCSANSHTSIHPKIHLSNEPTNPLISIVS